MVRRVYGKVDGIEVALKYTQGDRWSVQVPLDSDGEYIIEVLAEDEAGNVSYMAKMLFVVNGSMIRQYLIPLPYFAELLHGYNSYLINSDSIVTVQPKNITSTVLENKYKAVLI
jgi:hypothetical protein